MTVMKRFFTFLSFLIMVAVTFASGVIWLNNLLVSRRWYLDVVINKLPTPGKYASHELAAKAEGGLLSWLGWSAFDMSTVSTFIPFFGLLMLTFGLWRIFLKMKLTEDFPFFRSYERLTIALGLIGTLWGIIMIGYYPPEAVNMSNLVMCLHTALYSTLVAVVWVFIFVIPLKTIMHGWHRWISAEERNPEAGDLISMLDRLRKSVTATGNELSDMNYRTREFRGHLTDSGKELAAAAKSLKEFRERSGADAFEVIEKACSRISTTLDEIRNGSEHLASTGGKINKAADQMAKVMERQARLLETIEERLRESESQRNDISEKYVKAVAEKAAAEALAANAENARDDVENKLKKIKNAIK